MLYNGLYFDYRLLWLLTWMDWYSSTLLVISKCRTVQSLLHLCLILFLYCVKIISNTTISRPDPVSRNPLASETGGLSGKPLFNISTNILKEMYILTRVCLLVFLL